MICRCPEKYGVVYPWYYLNRGYIECSRCSGRIDLDERWLYWHNHKEVNYVKSWTREDPVEKIINEDPLKNLLDNP